MHIWHPSRQPPCECSCRHLTKSQRSEPPVACHSISALSSSQTQTRVAATMAAAVTSACWHRTGREAPKPCVSALITSCWTPMAERARRTATLRRCVPLSVWCSSTCICSPVISAKQPQLALILQFLCGPGDPKCIPRTWVCDTDLDCKDGEDEANATCGALSAAQAQKRFEITVFDHKPFTTWSGGCACGGALALLI